MLDQNKWKDDVGLMNKKNLPRKRVDCKSKAHQKRGRTEDLFCPDRPPRNERNSAIIRMCRQFRILLGSSTTDYTSNLLKLYDNPQITVVE